MISEGVSVSYVSLTCLTAPFVMSSSFPHEVVTISWVRRCGQPTIVARGRCESAHSHAKVRQDSI